MSTLEEQLGGSGNVIGGPFGSKLTQKDYTEEGVPVIRGSNMVSAGRWLGGGFAFVSEEKVEADLRSNLAQPGDIIVTQRGTLGQVAIVPDHDGFDRYVISQSQMAIRVPHQRANRDFVYYFLQSPQFVHYVGTSTIQTGVPHINLGILRSAPAIWPDREQQNEIASVLVVLDDKIELNRRMHETLESMARAIFKDWFIDFGPTRAKAEGREPYLAPEIWHLFPNAVAYDGIPPGWERVPVGEFIELMDHKRIPLSSRERASRQGPFPYHGATGVMDYIDDYIFDETLLLLGEDGSVVREDGRPYTQYVWGKLWVNNHAHVLRGKGVSVEQLKCFFDTTDIAPFVTGAVQAKLNQGNLKRVPFLRADPAIHSAFDAIAAPLFRRIKSCIDESRTLVNIRDLLLPKLMSGEIQLRDAEKAVEAAA